ncbi:hypothetical protein EPO04_00410 [Patescibacteria group bacterium]|nr:MAG: hypothetical protein EPO04_00410 [Patescibacteria group bacterium]
MVLLSIAMNIKHIAIIYNPKSTGDSTAASQQLYHDVREHLPHTGVELMPTKYRGHAADLTEILGQTRTGVVVVSVGGDGTYNEVINGAMRVAPSRRPVLVPFAAGNANDHSRELLGDAKVMSQLIAGDTQVIDLLRLSVHNPTGDDVLLHAHSYIGFGASGRVARLLDERNFGPISEKLIALGEILSPSEFSAVVNGHSKKLYSIVCSNVSVMGKYLKVSHQADLSDGHFEVVETEAHSRLELLKEVSQTATGQPAATKRVQSYSMMLMDGVQAQLDGEPISLSKASTVFVTVEREAIRTLAGE